MGQQQAPAKTAHHSEHNLSAVNERYLTFELDGEKYGVEILSVKEIIGLQQTTHIPQTPSHVAGVMNLRGAIIPVINLRLKLSIEAIKPEMDTAIIIVMIGDFAIGFIVDRVIEVANIRDEHLSAPPQFNSKIDTNYIRSMAQHGEHVIMLLNLSAIFQPEEMEGMLQLSHSNNPTLKEIPS